MKKFYEELSLELLKFEVMDIITSSVETDGDDDYDEIDDVPGDDPWVDTDPTDATDGGDDMDIGGIA